MEIVPIKKIRTKDEKIARTVFINPEVVGNWTKIVTPHFTKYVKQQ